MKSNAKNEDNLDDIYSDLSDQDHSHKRKNSSVSPKPPRAQVASIIKGPGGKVFVPPPPPPSSKPVNKTPIPDDILHSRSQPPGFHHHSGHHQNMRERKSTIYIKNIPKSCNRQQTLTTFFRTFGNIKSIKTYQQQHSAAVRFERQQDAYRFMTNKPLILNRSYIIYDTNEDFVVSPTSVQQREKDQVVVVGASEKQVIILKQNTQSSIADKYRCLLYLKKHSDRLTSEQQADVERQMSICRKIKESDSSNRELGEMLMNFENDYDWTLTYKQKTKDMIDKKKVISQYNIDITKKYGPIGTISAKISPPTAATDLPTDKTEEKVGVIKIKYLAVRSCWQMYLENSTALELEVEGSKLSSIFKAWFAKKQEQAVAPIKDQPEHKEDHKQQGQSKIADNAQVAQESEEVKKPQTNKEEQVKQNQSKNGEAKVGLGKEEGEEKDETRGGEKH